MDNGVPYIKDLPWFVVVLFRGYQELYEVNGNSKYINAILNLPIGHGSMLVIKQD